MTAAPLLGYPERCYTTQGAILCLILLFSAIF